MANRRISEFPSIDGAQIDEQDLLTLVHVFEVDPTLRNKKITFTQFRQYLDQYYANITGETITGNVTIAGNLTVTGTSSFTTITGSNLATFSGVVVQNNLTTSGTISGDTITGNTGLFSTISAVSGVFTSQVSGATVTGNSVQATTLTSVTGRFTQLSGTTITGNTVQTAFLNAGSGVFASGVFSSGTAAAPSVSVGTTNNGFYSPGNNQIAVATSGQARVFVTENGRVGIGAIPTTETLLVNGTINSNTITSSGALQIERSGVVVTLISDTNSYFNNDLRAAQFSGGTITGTVIQTTTITGVSGVFTTQLSGVSITGNTVNATTGTFNTLITSGHIVQNNLTVSGTISGVTLTGISGAFTNLTAATARATSFSGTTITGDTIRATTITGTNISGTLGAFNSIDVNGGQILGSIIITGTIINDWSQSIGIQTTRIIGSSGAFTNLSGGTTIGLTASFTSGIFTSQISGTTITGNAIQATVITGVTVTGTTARFTSGVFDTLTAANQTFNNAIIGGNLVVSGSGYFGSGINVSGTISGQTITGATAQFTNITGSTLHVTSPSGATAAFVCSGVVSGDANGFIVQGPLIILP